MRCESCGMAIVGKPIREEVDGRTYYYCCADCLEEQLCRRDRPLRVAFAKTAPRAPRRGRRYRRSRLAGHSP